VIVVTEIDGEKHILKDIFLRILKAEPELKLMQGFPEDYIIVRDKDYKQYPIKEQVERIGNSVVLVMARVLVEVNFPYLKIRMRIPNMRINNSQEQLRFA
jgi:uncharacterized protein YlzI (FlbEa/FlbD family)